MAELRKILIIDDTPTMRLIVTGMLEDLGFREVVQAESAEMAWKLLGAGHFDLVLADWNMPGQSGVELTRKVRGSAKLAGTPILMMTSNNDPAQIHEARVAGVSGYLVKPFGPGDLRSRMDEAFRFHDSTHRNPGGTA